LASDFRKYPRVVLTTAGRLMAIESGRSCVVRLRDVSEGGVAVTGVTDDWMTGAKVQIRCEGGGLPRPLAAEGVVGWRHEDAAGIAFTAVPPDAVATLGDYMDSATGTGRASGRLPGALPAGDPSA